MRKFGLIGYPLSHTFSPQYFAEKFEKEKIEDCSYEAFPISSIDELPALLASNPGLEGLNVTIPYKKKVIRFLEEGSGEVKQIIACNCIKIKKGKLYGYNTDISGFEQTFKPQIKPHHDKALILGTGGVSMAVEYVLRKLGISYVFVSRNRNGKHNCINYADLTESWMGVYTVIINTTPIGMYPNDEQAPEIPYEYLGPRHYLFDMVYNPVKTLFLQKGEKKGAIIKNGEEMLKIQADESWKIWNDDRY